MLAHKASHEARVAVEGDCRSQGVFEPQAIPAVVFTDPEIAWCGLTEAQAKEQNVDVDVAKFPWGALSRAITVDRPEGSRSWCSRRAPGACSAWAFAGRAPAS
jgi:dihydrolipoamide dehydrogenase